MQGGRTLAVRDNQEVAEGATASVPKSFAINAARPTPSPSSHRRVVQFCVAIALARAARRIAERSRASRSGGNNHRLDSQQLGKIFSVSRFDLACVSHALYQFISR